MSLSNGGRTASWTEMFIIGTIVMLVAFSNKLLAAAGQLLSNIF